MQRSGQGAMQRHCQRSGQGVPASEEGEGVSRHSVAQRRDPARSTPARTPRWEMQVAKLGMLDAEADA